MCWSWSSAQQVGVIRRVRTYLSVGDLLLALSIYGFHVIKNHVNSWTAAAVLSFFIGVFMRVNRCWVLLLLADHVRTYNNRNQPSEYAPTTRRSSASRSFTTYYLLYVRTKMILLV